MVAVPETHALGVEMLAQYDILDWKIRWNRMTGSAGEASYGNKTITLSAIAVEQWNWATVEELLKHEISHALVGPGHNHDRVWRKKVKELGGTPEEHCPEFSGLAMANPENLYFTGLTIAGAWIVSPATGLLVTAIAGFAAVVAIVRNARVLPKAEREAIEHDVLNP